MSEDSRTQIQALAAGLLGFVGVVGLGGFLILHQGGAAVKAPAVTYAPVDAASSLPTPVAAPANRPAAPAGGASSSSPAPLLSADETDPAPGAVQSSPANVAPNAASNGAAAGSPAAKLVVSQHLSSDSSSSASYTAAASVPRPAKAAAAKKKALLPQKLDLSKAPAAIASSVHYGVNDRAELMGRAAGPVYNFSDKDKAGADQSAKISADSASGDVVQQVDATRQQVDGSDMDAEQKAKVDSSLNQARQTMQGATP
jgi:hypothetical protein